MLSDPLARLSRVARDRRWTDAEWARRAGVRNETLSRIRHRGNCDFATLAKLAEAVGATLTALTELTPPLHEHESRDFPASFPRDTEDRLLDLIASGNRDASTWRAAGPAFFMAGLAMLCANVEELDRTAYLALAERLHRGASRTEVFADWLANTPVRAARFIPMLLRRLTRP